MYTRWISSPLHVGPILGSSGYLKLTFFPNNHCCQMLPIWDILPWSWHFLRFLKSQQVQKSLIMDGINVGHFELLIVPNNCYCNHFSWKLLPWSPLSKIWNSIFFLISSQELVSFLSAGADRIRSPIFKNYLTRMIQEGYLKTLRCILSEFERFAK